jgi:hypothetical protein
MHPIIEGRNWSQNLSIPNQKKRKYAPIVGFAHSDI